MLITLCVIDATGGYFLIFLIPIFPILVYLIWCSLYMFTPLGPGVAISVCIRADQTSPLVVIDVGLFLLLSSNQAKLTWAWPSYTTIKPIPIKVTEGCNSQRSFALFAFSMGYKIAYRSVRVKQHGYQQILNNNYFFVTFRHFSKLKINVKAPNKTFSKKFSLNYWYIIQLCSLPTQNLFWEPVFKSATASWPKKL